MDGKHITREQQYEWEIAEMQKQNHDLMVRLKEVLESNDLLRKQIEELLNYNEIRISEHRD